MAQRKTMRKSAPCETRDMKDAALRPDAEGCGWSGEEKTPGIFSLSQRDEAEANEGRRHARRRRNSEQQAHSCSSPV